MVQHPPSIQENLGSVLRTTNPKIESPEMHDRHSTTKEMYILLPLVVTPVGLSKEAFRDTLR